MNRTDIILVSGLKDSGKTSIINGVYKLLRERCSEAILDARNQTEDAGDFVSVLKVKDLYVGIISAGDILCNFKEELRRIESRLREQNINLTVLICASRALNREGSVYCYLTNEIAPNYQIAVSFNSWFCDSEAKWIAKERNIIEAICIYLNGKYGI